MNTKNIIIVVLILCLVATSSYVAMDLLKQNTKEADHRDVAQIEKDNDEDENENDNIVPEKEEPRIINDEIQQTISEISVRSLEEMYDKIHRMANSLIIAEDGEIWGEEAITEGEVIKLIKEVTASNYPDKETLLEILNRWKDGDFTQGDYDHNYVWEQLEGDTGKAIGVRPEFREVQPVNQND
jgi:hypothetical protein